MLTIRVCVMNFVLWPSWSDLWVHVVLEVPCFHIVLSNFFSYWISAVKMVVIGTIFW
jgi:hypothetical protein